MIEQAIAYIDAAYSEGRVEKYEYSAIRAVLAEAYDSDWVDANGFDNLPNVSGDYLTYDEHGKIEVCRFEEPLEKWFHTVCDSNGLIPAHEKSEDVDYWRLLPDVPCSD